MPSYIKQFTVVAIIILILLCTLSCNDLNIIEKDDWELSLENITKGRDMTLYKDGGHFRCCQYDPPDDRTNISVTEKTVRDFIWDNWSNKTRSYIRITYYGADTRHTTHFFVEPDNEENWVVRWIYLYKHAMPEYEPILKEGDGTPYKTDSQKRSGDWELNFNLTKGDSINSIPIF